MTPVYGDAPAHWWQTIGDGEVAAVSAVAVLGIWLGRPLPVLVVGVLVRTLGLRRIIAVVAIFAGLAGVWRGDQAWRDVVPDRLGPFQGVACLASDPAPRSGAVVAVFEIGGERYEAWARGSSGRRLTPHLSGECAWITGNRRALSPRAARRAAVRHVVAGLDLRTVGDWSHGAPIDRASNRVRRIFAAGAAELTVPDDALFAGLVIGDDRNEPPAVINQFRAAGLSHLTAVSGQNVAYVLAGAAPLLRRLRPMARWSATVGIIAWFVALTRFEPSVLRAGLMAGIAATGFLLGREKPPGRVLALAVGVLALVDPLLVWSVGFWLSVGATAGVALLSTRLAALVPGPDWLALPAGVTLAAQAGVAPVSLLVFGTLPLVSLPANLLAVPVAGLVMLYGLPAGLAAGALHGGPLGWLAATLQLPSAIGTRWVATVAALGARLDPATPWTLAGWTILVASLAGRWIAVRRRRVCEG